MRQAEYWEAQADGRVRCGLCPHECHLAEGKTGLCRVRTVRDGVLVAAGYGLVSSAALDPVEKKPLYHFHPGRDIFSVGGWGCNFACAFCQNWTISQQVLDRSSRFSAETLVAKAAAENSVGIAYTYNEPLVGYEFLKDCARLARERGLMNVLVTNGFIHAQPASELLPLVDAANIDIKSMQGAFYHEHCRGRLRPVLDFAEQARQAGCHVEITNLLVPGLNDSDECLRGLVDWVCDSLGKKTPVHLSAYRPMFKMDVPSTPLDTLEHAYDLCAADLPYVYLGNVLSDRGSNTLCPVCDGLQVRRTGYQTQIAGIENGCCRTCGAPADFVL